MRVVLILSYLLGIALPVLETYRRGFEHWMVNSMTMAGDYLMGAVLLVAALAFSFNKKCAGVLMVIAWSYVLGVMNAAFWGHLEGAIRGITQCDNDPLEFKAIAVKGVIWGLALMSVYLSARWLYLNKPQIQ
ncbi:hypothetical protein RN22_08065 [Grimontia sp. AD028]|uniref:hypothetical protein n=1 Tax=Grimontia sp. AD028 TaxID=1581149 RepID=UPI00061B20AF|nr:hypothetical protein [Grimontia sp. AD028]KKD60989.1 hypothetical protein RN22_08065 [Grimontia sp. AD028]